MKDLSIKEFSDLVYEKLEKLYKNKPILSRNSPIAPISGCFQL